MRNYVIFEHPDGRVAAVKSGFSWPGFLFCPIWLLLKRLWLHAAAIITILFFLNLIDNLNKTNQNYDDTKAIIIVAQCIIWAVAGGFGNQWCELNLRKRGYEVVSRGQAFTSDGAAADYLNKKQQAVENGS